MLLQADARAIPLQDESVQCVVTSPPYWGLRAYEGEQRGVWGGEAEHEHEWALTTRASQHTDDGVTGSTLQGGTGTQAQAQRSPSTDGTCPCGAWYGALGLEPTPELYVEHMVEVFREVKRVLRPDGTLWLNLGDSYSGYHGNSRVPDEDAPSNKPGYVENMRASTVGVSGLKPKDLLMMPHRVALALQADGWWVRSDIVWSKPNPMPESVTDRPTKAHEYMFLLAKSERYFYDADAIREPHTAGHLQKHLAPLKDRGDQRQLGKQGYHDFLNPLGRNARTVWTIATQPYPGAHFATYPEKLVEPCILAGSSPKACGVCAAPWERVTERGIDPNYIALGDRPPHGATQPGNATIKPGAFGDGRPATTTGWRSTCEHDDDSGSCVVLDPFAGSGTTLRVATRLGRQAVGLDISREYLTEQATKRTTDIQIGLEAMGL